MNGNLDKESRNEYTAEEPVKEQNTAEAAAPAEESPKETVQAAPVNGTETAAPVNETETAAVRENAAAASASDGLYHGKPAQSTETPFQPYSQTAQTQNGYGTNPQGYAQTAQTQSGAYGSSQYAQGYAQNQNAYAQTQNGYGANPQGYAQTAQPQTGAYGNPYAQSQSGYDQNRPYFGGYSGAYQPQNGGYAAPAQPVRKQKKERSGKAGLAVLVVCCILFSGLFGFGGAYLANSIHPASSAAVTESAKGGQSVVYQAVPSDGSTAAPQSENAIVNAAGRAKDSVVEITTEVVQTSTFYGQYVTEGAGSGVIITPDGYIITCAHVVEGASTVTVRLTDGTELPAEVVGEDSQTDIAVLKISAEGLTPAVIGDSDGLVVGETAIAIGNPLGELGGSVSSGIISALNREITIDGENYNLLQTTAAINPGNSGGGLFNIKGELIGIVNAKSAGSSIEGLGFSIPIKNAMSVAEQLMEYGYIKGRVRLGINVAEINSSTNTFSIYQQNPALMKYITEYGVYFLEYSGGQTGGLEFGDRIVAIDGTAVSALSDIRSLLNDYSVGDEVTITVARLTGTGRTAQSKMIDIPLTLVESVPEK